MKNKKLTIMGMVILLVASLFLGVISAKEYSIVCLKGGETIQWSLCNPRIEDYTCLSIKEQCSMCAYMGSAGHLCPATETQNPCNALGLTCGGYEGGDENETMDFEPPTLNIISPANGIISPSKKIFLNFSLNEMADVYYRDLNKNTNSWTKVCDNCNSGNPSYAKIKSFAEGENNLLFKAVDASGNEANQTIKFNVDSISPRIYKTYPLSGFTNCEFEVQFKEANPKRVTLNYGVQKENLDIASDCTGPDSSGKTNCITDINLDAYNGQEIQYYFEIEDVAGKTYKSKAVKIKIDTVAPVINNPDSFYPIKGRYVNFNISITEDNFYKATYVNNNDPKLIEKTLCTRLTNGNCAKKQSFSNGHYDLTIVAYDKAGHSSFGYPANFDI